MGYAGDGDLVVPYKRKESTSWLCRSMHNQDIRSQRMVNEWGVKIYCQPLPSFPWSLAISSRDFHIPYQTAAMVSNWQLNRRGYALLGLFS